MSKLRIFIEVGVLENVKKLATISSWIFVTACVVSNVDFLAWLYSYCLLFYLFIQNIH